MGREMMKNKYLDLHFRANEVRQHHRKYKMFLLAFKYFCGVGFMTVWLWGVIAFVFAAHPGSY
jgi:hypothetical protein